MKKIAITGGIGAGKSSIGKLLLEKDFTVIDSDEIVRSLYERIEVQGKIRKIFGSLKKEEIAEQAFSDSAKREELEKILHPLVKEEIEKIQGEILFVEVPLLFETGMEEDFDFVVAVKASEEARIERMKEKGMSEEEVMKRIRAQLSDSERVKKADLVIDNDGNLRELEARVKELIGKVIG